MENKAPLDQSISQQNSPQRPGPAPAAYPDSKESAGNILQEGQRPAAVTEDRLPFMGPGPFATGDASMFFGRDQESRDLRALIKLNRAVLMYAQSGAGKTSLLNAGLMPLLAKEKIEVLPPVRVSGLLPEGVSADQLDNRFIFNVLYQWSGNQVDAKTLLTTRLSEFLRGRKSAPSEDEGGFRLQLMVFDQFEEIFSMYSDRPEKREEFILQVREALDHDPLLRCLFVIREDYLARFDRYAPILPDRLRARYRLEPLREKAALQAIRGPLNVKKIALDPGVAETLVQQLLAIKEADDNGKPVTVTGEFVEPVQLQVVCQALYSLLSPGDKLITLEHIRKLNVDKALMLFYEESVKKAAEKAKIPEDGLRSWIGKHLITELNTRGMVAKGETTTLGIPTKALDELEHLHLILSERRLGAICYELTHDRLIEPIQRSQRRYAAINPHDEAIRQNPKDTTAYVKKARALGMLGEYDEALQVFELAFEKDRNNAEMYLERARLESEHGHWEQAIADFNEGIRLKPGDKTAHKERANAHLVLKNYGEAVEDFKTLIQLAPADTNAQEIAVKQLVELGLLQEAEAVLGRMLLANSENAWAHNSLGYVYRKSGKPNEAIVEGHEALRLSPSYPAAYFNIGNALRQLGRYDEAIAMLDRAIELDPTYIEAHNIRGLIYSDKKDYAQAIAAFDGVLKLNPGYQWAYANQGEALRQLGRHDKGLTVLARAIEIAPDYLYAYQTRAMVYFDQAKYAEALADLNKAAELGPHDEWTMTKNGDALRLLGRNDEALSMLDRALQIDPKSVRAYNVRGLVLLDKKESTQALAQFEKALELDCRYQWAYANKGETLRQMRRYDEALQELERAVAIDPAYVYAYQIRATVHFDRARYAEALADLNRATELAPRDEWNLSKRSDALRLLGRYEEALRESDRAIEINPAYAFAYQTRASVHVNQSDYAQALLDVSKAAELAPEDPTTHTQKAEVLGKLGRFAEALDSIREALKLNPQDFAARGSKAEFLLRLDQREEAVEDLEAIIQRYLQSCEEDPAQAGSYYSSIAWYYYLKDDFENAIQAGRKAIALQYDDVRVSFNIGVASLACGRVDEAREAYASALCRIDEIIPGTFDEAMDDVSRLLQRKPEVSDEAKRILQLLTDAKREKLAAATLNSASDAAGPAG